MFDIGKSYSVVVWDMPVAVLDIELDDFHGVQFIL